MASTFVVQRGRSVPTLSSVSRSSFQSVPRGKEHLNTDSKNDERGETDDFGSKSPELSVFERMRTIPVAGRPSDASSPSSHRRSSSSLGGEGAFSARKSRRNSIDENYSQLSIENLCGSQNNAPMLGRNPDKEMRTHVRDNRDVEDGNEKCNNEIKEMPESKVSFAELRKQKAHDQFHSSGISINYTQSEKSDASKTSRDALLNDPVSSKVSTNVEPRDTEPSPSLATSPGISRKLF